MEAEISAIRQIRMCGRARPVMLALVMTGLAMSRARGVAGECAEWCTGLRRPGAVGLGVGEGRRPARRVDGGENAPAEPPVNISAPKRISTVGAACQMAPSVGTVPWSYGAARVRAECWDSVESSWTPWNMIDNLHRADQACLVLTDATRTAAGFDRA